VKGGLQGVCTGLGRVLGESALCFHNDVHGVWAGLVGLRRPEAGGGVLQGILQRAKLLAAGSVEGPEGRRPSSHGKLGGGTSGKVGGVTLHRIGARKAKAAVREGGGCIDRAGGSLRWGWL
jgi:hypothetical protein